MGGGILVLSHLMDLNEAYNEGRENFPEAVLVIAKIPLVLPSSEGRGKLGTTRTTVWFMVEYCQNLI